MKNFEQNFDKAINCLREINEILKECNLEMQKALGETKGINYAIYQPETDTFYNKNINTFVFKLSNSTLFKTSQMARQQIEILEKTDPAIVGTLEIKIIQLKVVE